MRTCREVLLPGHRVHQPGDQEVPREPALSASVAALYGQWIEKGGPRAALFICPFPRQFAGLPAGAGKSGGRRGSHPERRGGQRLAREPDQLRAPARLCLLAHGPGSDPASAGSPGPTRGLTVHHPRGRLEGKGLDVPSRRGHSARRRRAGGDLYVPAPRTMDRTLSDRRSRGRGFNAQSQLDFQFLSVMIFDFNPMIFRSSG